MATSAVTVRLGIDRLDFTFGLCAQAAAFPSGPWCRACLCDAKRSSGSARCATVAHGIQAACLRCFERCSVECSAPPAMVSNRVRRQCERQPGHRRLHALGQLAAARAKHTCTPMRNTLQKRSVEVRIHQPAPPRVADLGAAVTPGHACCVGANMTASDASDG